MAETQNVSQEDMPIGYSPTLRAHFSRQAPVHLTLDPTETKSKDIPVFSQQRFERP